MPGNFPGLLLILGLPRLANNCPQYRFSSSLGSNTPLQARKTVPSRAGRAIDGTEVATKRPEKTIPHGQPSP